MNKNRFCLLTATIFLITTTLPVNQSYPTEESGWNVQHVVGKYLVADPPKEDQTFIVYYKALNGTVDWIGGTDYFAVNVESTKSAMLELKIPRNYPYTNDRDYNSEGKNMVIFIDDKETDSSKYFPIVEDCFFVYSIPFTANHKIEMAFSYFPINYTYHGDEVPDYCLKETIVIDHNTFQPPLRQYKSGISISDIVCKHGLELVLKSSNGNPACVKPDTKEKLIERGWAKLT